jgi:hypothetical protein
MGSTIRSLTVILIMGGLVASQQKPSFDAASIKPGNPRDARSWGVHIQPGGWFRCENATVKTAPRFCLRFEKLRSTVRARMARFSGVYD